MDERDRQDLERTLLAGAAELPTSAFGRLGRTAMTALRGARMTRRRQDQPLDAGDLARVVSAIGSLKGVAMKMAQIMSYIDVALPDELRSALAVLQTHSQPMPFERVRAIIELDLGDRAGALLARMEEAPIAAASIGQVHRAWLPDGTAVAVKIQYPDIEKAIASDFRPAAIGTRMAKLVYAGADVRPLIEEARARFLEECDYLAESRSQLRFAALYAGDLVVQVPAVEPDYCARHVLTSHWIDGARFETYLAGDPPQEERDRLGAALFEFYLGSLFRHGLYNCDPHPGNYLLLGEGRIAILDYGCVRAFEPAFVDKLGRLTRAVHADNPADLEASLLELGLVRAGRRYDFATARDLVRSFYGPMLRDQVQAVEPAAAMGMSTVLQRKRELMRLALPGEFLFLFRIRFGLMSVLARLGARANWYQLERRCIEGGAADRTQ